MNMGKRSNTSRNKKKGDSKKKKEELEFLVWSDDIFPYDVLVHKKPT